MGTDGSGHQNFCRDRECFREYFVVGEFWVPWTIPFLISVTALKLQARVLVSTEPNRPNKWVPSREEVFRVRDDPDEPVVGATPLPQLALT